MEKTDIRVQFTKRILRESLVALMKTKSILNITVREICETAGVSRTTFYAYYKDQYDLLEQMEEEIFAEIDRLIGKHSQIGTMPPAKELTVMIEAILQYIINDSKSIQVFLSENGESNFQRKFARYFTGLMQRFKNTPGSILANKRILNYYSVFIRDGCIAILQEWIKNGIDINIRGMAKLFSKLVRDVLT
jgi:AcrR family transcriptional regulator